MKILDEYFSLQEKIYDYFGYEEEPWTVFPLDDKRTYQWMIFKNQIFFADLLDEDTIKTGNTLYSGWIALPHWVYRGKDHTMILNDTMSNGNIFLSVFFNDLEKTGPYLAQLLEEYN